MADKLKVTLVKSAWPSGRISLRAWAGATAVYMGVRWSSIPQRTAV